LFHADEDHAVMDYGAGDEDIVTGEELGKVLFFLIA
jgi:hypothetical protein